MYNIFSDSKYILDEFKSKAEVLGNMKILPKKARRNGWGMEWSSSWHSNLQMQNTCSVFGTDRLLLEHPVYVSWLLVAMTVNRVEREVANRWINNPRGWGLGIMYVNGPRTKNSFTQTRLCNVSEEHYVLFSIYTASKLREHLIIIV